MQEVNNYCWDSMIGVEDVVSMGKIPVVHLCMLHSYTGVRSTFDTTKWRQLLLQYSRFLSGWYWRLL